MSMAQDSTTNISSDIIRQSVGIDVTAPLAISPTLNEIYQQKIDDRIYAYKDAFIKKLSNDPAGAEAIRQLSREDLVSALRENFDKTLPTLIPMRQKLLMAKLGESIEYSGIYFGETVVNRPEAVTDMIRNMPVRQDALLLRKNDALVLFAHGGQTGTIAFNGAEYAPQDFVRQLYGANLIPEDIKRLYTLNCYGGKQQSFIGPGGVQVQSAHTSTTPIIGGAMMDPDKPLFVTSLNTGDMTDEFKRFSLEDGELTVLYSADEVKQALESAAPLQQETSVPGVESQPLKIDVTEPLRPEPTLDELYQQKLDRNLYATKDALLSAAEHRAGPETVAKLQGLEGPEFSSEARRFLDDSVARAYKHIMDTSSDEVKELIQSELGEGKPASFFGDLVTSGANELRAVLGRAATSEELLLLRKNKSLMLFAHGLDDGKILFNGVEYTPQDLVQKLYDAQLVPDDIESIYTMNCYGGKQQSFIGPGGVRVQPGHTSQTSIMGTVFADTREGASESAPALFKITTFSGDINEGLKAVVVEDGSWDVLHSADEIRQALEGDVNEPHVEQVEVSVPESVAEPEPEDVFDALVPEAYSDEFYLRQGKNPVAERQAVREWYESKGYDIPDDLKKYFPDLTEQVVSPDSPYADAPELRSVAEEVAAEHFPDADINKSELTTEQWQEVVSTTEESIGGEIDPIDRALDEAVEAERVHTEAKAVIDDVKASNPSVADDVADAAQNAAKQADAVSDAAKGMQTKMLGSGGKLAIGLAIAGMIIGTANRQRHQGMQQRRQGQIDDLRDERRKGNTGARLTTGNYYDSQLNNAHAARVAANISSYGYGRRIGGFM